MEQSFSILPFGSTRKCISGRNLLVSPPPVVPPWSPLLPPLPSKLFTPPVAFFRPLNCAASGRPCVASGQTLTRPCVDVYSCLPAIDPSVAVALHHCYTNCLLSQNHLFQGLHNVLSPWILICLLSGLFGSLLSDKVTPICIFCPEWPGLAQQDG